MKIKSILLLFSFALLSNSVFSQKKITWKNVLDVYAKEFRLKEKNPTSKIKDNGISLEDLENKKVKIVGYFLDVDPNGEWFVLSKNPFATCFFCGKAGPETVLELLGFENAKKKFKSDDVVEVTGIFSAIYDLDDRISFIIDKASLKKVNK